VNHIQFGVFLNPIRSRAEELTINTVAAEQAGFDYVSIQDHPYVGELLDPFSLIGVLIGRTSRIGFMTNVSNLPTRPPALLAKAAATLDVLSGGRFELGIGGGRNRDAVAALGGPTWTPRETLRAVDEAISISRHFWGESTEGLDRLETYSLGRVAPGPVPAHRIGIWLGAVGPKMLDLLGERADGWIAPLGIGYETKPFAQDRIDQAALAAGRQPDEVRRVVQLVGEVTEQPITRIRPRSGPGWQPIRTDPDGWARIITEFVHDERFDTINFLPEIDSMDQITAFGNQVIPRVNSLLEPVVDRSGR
jgi:alkanesulfonate monooxygenase SsuD/methylene tetrahydromethanopterin reductase-like flavin-dependent oxidoreductase (luciferase family)